jgi:hypothetical protein
MPDFQVFRKETIVPAFLSLLKKYEDRIQAAYYDALMNIQGEMKIIYDKYAIDGILTTSDLAKYNRYAAIEEQLLDILEPAIKRGLYAIKTALPELYKQSFFYNEWALDMTTGIHLGLLIPSAAQIAKLFSIEEINNKFYAESLKEYTIVSRRKIREALMNGLAQGKTFEAMSRDLSKAIDISNSRALKIVRTEGMNALTAGSDYTYYQALDNGVKGYMVWDAVLDLRTRPDHAAMDGKKKDMETGLYTLPNGETTPYPHWEGLSPEQRCNCRCLENFFVEGHEPKYRRTKEQGIIPYMTYNEWYKKYHGGGE